MFPSSFQSAITFLMIMNQKQMMSSQKCPKKAIFCPFCTYILRSRQHFFTNDPIFITVSSSSIHWCNSISNLKTTIFEICPPFGAVLTPNYGPEILIATSPARLPLLYIIYNLLPYRKTIRDFLSLQVVPTSSFTWSISQNVL